MLLLALLGYDIRFLRGCPFLLKRKVPKEIAFLSRSFKAGQQKGKPPIPIEHFPPEKRERENLQKFSILVWDFDIRISLDICLPAGRDFVILNLSQN